jgi:predicted DNA-binding transcriptional regulator YafY
MAELEISHATFKRDIAKLRDQLHVPSSLTGIYGGYRLEQGHTDSELPGLWFSQDELACAADHSKHAQPVGARAFGPKLKPLQQRLAGMLEEAGAQ